MLRACLLGFLALLPLCAADGLAKPDKISIHTWVREDMFAGWIGNDDVTFERGVAKVDRYLSDDPTNRDALAWKFLAASHHMIHVRAKGDGELWGETAFVAGKLGNDAERDQAFTRLSNTK